MGDKDITHALDQMVRKVKTIAVHASQVWNECFEKLAGPDFGLLEELQKPRAPEGCFDLGTCVEVSWGSHETVRWWPAQVLGVHNNKDKDSDYDYVVRYERGGAERNVHPKRVRPPAPDTLTNRGRGP